MSQNRPLPSLKRRWIALLVLGALLMTLDATAEMSRENSENPEIQDLINQAALARSEGKLDQAAELYGKAIQRDAGNYVLYRNLGVLFYEKGDYLSAGKSLLSANKIKSDDFLTLLYTGRVLLKVDDPQTARPYLEQAAAMNPEFPDLAATLGDLKRKLKEYREAEALYEKAVQAAPQSAEGYRGLGLLYYETYRNKLAVENFEEALKISPEDGDLWYNLGMSYFAQDNLDRAAECLHRSLTYKPNNAESFYALGLIFEKANQWELAEKSFSKALEIRPDHEDAKKHLSEVQWKYRMAEERRYGPLEGFPGSGAPRAGQGYSGPSGGFPSPADRYNQRRRTYAQPNMGGSPFIDYNEMQPASGGEALMAIAQALFGAITNRNSDEK